LLYTQGYLQKDKFLGRFLLCLMAFMGSMLGLVFSNHLLMLFIFWELTSFTSYLLIGFNHEDGRAREAALRAMLVTVSGGLVLLAGLLLMVQATGTWYLSELLAQKEGLREHAYYIPILICIALGAFTKSAQFPFHFWLPGAMQAPTPASAYLHSSTMVKAGVYLLARLFPVMGGTPEWSGLLTTIGALTFMVGAIMALGQHILKRLLAYTTVSALGAMVLLIGIGTAYTIKAMVIFLVAHAFYKAALFMVAGALTHETGEKSVDALSGLRRVMPFTFIGALIAGLSMGGVPPLFGFVAKEVWLHAVGASPGLILATVIGGVAYMMVGLSVGWKPFVGENKNRADVHEAPWLMRIGPLLLGVGSILLAFYCGAIGKQYIAPAANVVYGDLIKVDLHLWEGFNRYFWMSLTAIILGVIAYRMRPVLLASATRLHVLAPLGSEAAYQRALKGLLGLAGLVTRRLQTGLLRNYIRIAVVFTLGLMLSAYLHQRTPIHAGVFSGILPQLGLLLVIMAAAVIGAVLTASRLAAILCLGIVGYGIAILFSFYGAPDLAMTQLVIESLTVILIALAFYHLPNKRHQSSRRTRYTDGLIATLFGLAILFLVLIAQQVEHPTPVSDFFLEQSYLAAHGRNVVNVILVDFRALDTLGEITVLFVAALGGVALLKLKPKNEEQK
jgi:multicomponent Na+:H+ antiporter subunit A